MMKAIITNKNRLRNQILVGLFASFCHLSVNVDRVLSGGADTSSSSTEQASATSAYSQSIGVTPTTFIQTGTNNYANVNSSTGALNYPNCGGTCAFAIMRTIPANNINGNMSNQIEGVIGLIHTFNSPDQTNADTNRQLVDIQKQRSETEIATNYIKAIADACQAKDSIRAELTAKALGRIWNVDYKTLLNPSCG